jgi:hypothetical protein
LVSGSRKIKVKFAETRSEPFASRIFDALGYHVQPTDYTPYLRIKYDRRLFLEFNSRAALKMKIGLFFVPIHTFNFQRSYDAFDFITHAVFDDGTSCTGNELRQRLLHNPAARKHYHPEDFRAQVEGAIDHLVTVPANVQIKEDLTRSIGPWDFGGLGHEDLRELRGAGVLAAWLGWWDARFDNTRLRIVQASEGTELRHYFSDLGAGLGLSRGTYRHSSEEPNQFEWTFTRSSAPRRIAFPGYEPIEDTLAFKRITFDDSRWMARLIGQLTEEQIIHALVASGFDSAEVRLYSEKLISRRDQLILDTELEGEFKLLRSGAFDRRFNYVPAEDGAVSVRIAGGRTVHAPIGSTLVRDGRVVSTNRSPAFSQKAAGVLRHPRAESRPGI